MKNKSAFTLVESITGIIIFGIISVSSWYAIDALFRSGEMSRDRNTAINLLQKSQEELRNSAKTFFMDLQNCQYPGPAMTGNFHNCGFADITNTFSGYTRSLAVELENGSTELKKATITVAWTIFGQDKSLQSVVLLARPPDPLPGNIYGKIASTQNANLIIPNVSLKVRFNTNSTSADEKPASPSMSTLGAKGENYDFKKVDGTYDLKPGYWTLYATHPNYKDYVSPEAIRVEPSTETPYHFRMEPKLEDGHLQVRLINQLTGEAINAFTYAYIAVNDDGPGKRIATTAQSQISFANPITIPFTDQQPKNFTVFTWQTYMAGYVSPTERRGGISCPYDFSENGWSSAVMQENGNLLCNNPFEGSAASDRIMVNPGEDVLVPIPLVPVPEVLVSGKVIDAENNPIANAIVQSLWWNGYAWRTSVKTDGNGRYTLSVPAAQGFLPESKKMTIRAIGKVRIRGCCNQGGYEDRTGGIVAANLFPNQTYTVPDIKIIGDTYHCGDLDGHITDGNSGLTINDVKITVKGIVNATDSGGYYIYQCSNDGDHENQNAFRISQGIAKFTAAKDGYHTFISDNPYSPIYNPLPANGVMINENMKNLFDTKLWPYRRGSVKVHVAEGNNPVRNIKVTLDGAGYDSTAVTLYTDANGDALFNNVLESWPPPDLPTNDNFYRHAVKGHKVTVTDPSKMYLNPDPVAITDIRPGQVRTVPVYVTTGGGA